MSLLLGTYFKDGNLDETILKDGFDNFTHLNKRKIESFKQNKFRLDFSQLWSKKENSYYENNGIYIWLSGDIHTIETSATNQHIQKNDYLKVIYDSYLKSELNIFKYLSGEFSIVIYNNNSNKLLLANDFFGLYPLFVCDFGKYFVFCNEYEPIVKFKEFNKKLDNQAISEYFTLGFSLGNNTFFSNIKNLEPGTILQFENNNIIKIKYGNYKVNIQHSAKPENMAKDIASILKPSVTNIIHSPEKLLCTLTGGLDTRLVLSNISPDFRKKLEFITISTPYLSQDEDKDILIAKRIADELKLNHSVDFFPSWHIQYDKEFDVSFFNTWREKAEKRGITGVYGTELMNGGWYNMMSEIIRNQIVARKKTLSFKNIFKKKRDETSDLSAIFSDQFLKQIDYSTSHLELEINNQSCENKYYQFAIEHITRGFFTYFHSGTRNKWHHTHDLLTNIVTPFSDKKLLLYLLSIPFEYLADNNFRIYNMLYKNHYPELIHISTTSKFGLVPGNCIAFYNSGKDPLNERKFNYRKINEQIINDNLTWDKNIYNKNSLIRNIQQNPDLLNKFIDFEAWYRYFVS